MNIISQERILCLLCRTTAAEDSDYCEAHREIINILENDHDFCLNCGAERILSDICDKCGKLY